METILIVLVCALIIAIVDLYRRNRDWNNFLGKALEQEDRLRCDIWRKLINLQTDFITNKCDTNVWIEHVRKETRDLADKLGYEWKEESKEAGFVKKPEGLTISWGDVKFSNGGLHATGTIIDPKDNAKKSKSTKKAKK